MIEVPEGYALVGIDALKAWGKYEEVCDACRVSMAPQAIEAQGVRNLLARYENQWHRMGELWERCQGKVWPKAESEEFARLRDELTPATRALLLSSAPPTPQASRVQKWPVSQDPLTQLQVAAIISERGESPQASVVQQEPLGFMNAGHVYELQKHRVPYGYVYPEEGAGAHVAVYTHPAKPQPLTNEQREAVFAAANGILEHGAPMSWEHVLVDAVEAAHGITKGPQQ